MSTELVNVKFYVKIRRDYGKPVSSTGMTNRGEHWDECAKRSV
ncbi:MAG: hypothetical protein ACR5K9_11310 [Wolbachia sp.]